MKVRSRFSYFRDKLQVFILGFLLGIVLGGGFFLLKLDSYVKELSFYKSLTQKDDKDENDLQPVKGAEDKPKAKKPKDKPRTYTATDNISMRSDSLAASDTSFSQGFTPEAGGDEIVIRKDEMLDTKPMAISNLDIPADSANTKTAADNGHYITIEFWKSPLNYRGYKFSRSRLVLFGFETADVAGLYKSQNSTYLKTSIGVFRLEASSDFHQFERVTDESLIARMQ
jgi:hypothetical protein